MSHIPPHPADDSTRPTRCLFCGQPGWLVTEHDQCPERSFPTPARHHVMVNYQADPETDLYAGGRHPLVDLDCPICGEPMHGGECE